MKRYTFMFAIPRSMIKRTFRILPSIGAAREVALWREGILFWDDFLSCGHPMQISPKRKEDYDAIIKRAEEYLSSRDASSLGTMLPPSETWRLYHEFRDSAAFLDIETDGLGPGCEVSVVGIHGPAGDKTLVSGIDLEPETINSSLKGASLLITFNGSCFDLPVLRSSFPSLRLNIPHLDLRFAAIRANLKGGLKSIENQLGIIRDEDIIDIDGAEAVKLWHRWKRGSEKALITLMEYNRPIPLTSKKWQIEYVLP